MIGLEAKGVPPVFVSTSRNGGLSADQLTELCCNKIISVSEDAPHVIRQQAEAFRLRMQGIVHFYISQAMQSERDTCVQTALAGGYKDLSDLLRRK